MQVQFKSLKFFVLTIYRLTDKKFKIPSLTEKFIPRIFVMSQFNIFSQLLFFCSRFIYCRQCRYLNQNWWHRAIIFQYYVVNNSCCFIFRIGHFKRFSVINLIQHYDKKVFFDSSRSVDSGPDHHLSHARLPSCVLRAGEIVAT